MSVLPKLQTLLGPDGMIVGDGLEQRYHHIWKMDQSLNALAVALPKSTEEVSAVLKICNEAGQQVVMHGGLTNLVGGTETEAHQLVISLERMNNILEVDAGSRTITTEAGVILQHVLTAAEEADLFFPLNFGAKGSAQVGGVVSSNAGGLRVFRYGMTRDLVLGLEGVLADGTIVSGLKKIIKDNSGYDLKQLFIGSEGTLGIVTKVVFKLYEKPTSRQSAIVAIKDYASVVQFLKYMDAGLSGLLSGFELMWDNYYRMATSPPALMKPPLPHGQPFYVLIESLGTDNESELEKMERLLMKASDDGLIADGAMAQSQSDLDWFWTIREDVHACVSQMTVDQHFDISLPIPLIGDTLNVIIEELHAIDEVEQVVTFGHVADGNIHLIIGKKHGDAPLTLVINDIVYAPLKAIGGSVSAEHGIGLHKKAYLQHSRSETEISMMKVLKETLDPKGILNPGRIFD